MADGWNSAPDLRAKIWSNQHFAFHKPPAFPAGNRLLAALSPDERAFIEDRAETVILPADCVIGRPGVEIDHMYFPIEGLGCELGCRNSVDQMEVRCFGREGLTGWPLLIGHTVGSYLTICATRLVALRLARPDVFEIVQNRPQFHRALLGYLRDVASEIAETAMDAARCNIEHRLARWLLGKHDRLDGADLPFTHAFMARAMGVRRAGITNAVHVLEGEHLIKARRGHIVVLDRNRLAHVAVEGPQLLRRMGS